MKKGILQVMVANIICMLISILTNFMLPRYLSIETYNIIKSYTLYLSYAGLFAFGYTDGIYLKYGGVRIDKSNQKSVRQEFYTYFIFQLFMTSLIFVGAIVVKNELLTVFAIGVLITNLGGYLKILYQATGEFGEYGKALNLEKIIVFLVNVFLIFALKTDKSVFYLLAQVLGPIITFVYLFYTYRCFCPNVSTCRFSIYALRQNISVGFVLTIGSIVDILFTGLDRWFIKILMGTKEFALYSFAVSLENIISTFTSPMSITLYNFFCQGIKKEKTRKIKKMLLLFGFCLLVAVFPAKWIVKHYIEKYVESIEVILYLFIAQFFYMIIRSVYVNVYKAQKKQKEYLKQIIVMLTIAFLTNIIFFVIMRKMEAFAIATCLTSVIWFVWCEIIHNEIRYNIKEYVCITIVLVSCFVCGSLFSAITGLLIYVLIMSVTSTILLHSAVADCFIYIEKVIKKIFVKYF